MGFFNANFLLERRTEWFNSLKTFQYRVDDTWYDALIASSKIEGNKIKFTVDIPKEPEVAHTITGIRILDAKGDEAGSQQLHIERSGIQPLLALFEFPIQEV